MGRGKGAHARKDGMHEHAVPRRPVMEPLPFQPVFVVPTKRFARPFSPVSPPPAKRPRPSPPPVPRFLYQPHRHLDVALLLPPGTPTRLVDVLIPAEHFTTANPALFTRQLWGTETYTDDSDIVAMLAHSGCGTPPESPLQNLEYVRVRLSLFRRDKSVNFESRDSGGLLSRFWPGDRYDGACMTVENVELLYLGDETVSLSKPVKATIAADVPGLVPLGVAEGRGKRLTGRNVRVGFDMCNEPCLKYDTVAVEGLDARVEERLEKEVLYVENETERFELASVGREEFRFARVKERLIKRLLLEGVIGTERECKFPIKEADVTVLDVLPWREFYWDKEGVSVRGKHFRVTKMFFRERNEKNSE